MCGIIALAARPARRTVPSASEVLDALDRAVRSDDPAEAARATADADRLLRGVPGLECLLHQRDLTVAIVERLDRLDAAIAAHDSTLDAAPVDRLEELAAGLIALRDATWAIRRDRLGMARRVEDLAGRDAGRPTVAAYHMIEQAFAAIDRLEVRGRDSAGVHLFVWDHALAVDDPSLVDAVRRRSDDPLFLNRSVRAIDGGRVLSFVYKAAAEIGELGDNTSAMRAAVREDDLLRRALAGPSTRVSLVGHTRWASVGIISEPNAHPVNSESDTDAEGPYVIAALNGDVDNHADLRIQHGLRFPAPITTDAKVIPALVALHGRATSDVTEAFRRTVSAFEGSVAIAAADSSDPERILLALHGSGQGLYVGLADDLFIAASEPYGVVEETSRYVRMDGEAVVDGTRGQIVVLDGRGAGELTGISRVSYSGASLPMNESEVVHAEVTTRDIDRGDAPHYLLKEITEAPDSFRKTLRGRIVESDGRVRVVLGPKSLPTDVVRRLADGSIDKVRVIGQGTAAVAGQACAMMLDELCDGALDVDPVTATEFSGFGLRLDMSDTLVVAVSQSGSTTDTYRTVDLARSRGAAVIAIVNRRGSDLCDKADGVIFTSDGRDVEMSVASTQAVYAQ
ncbi:MAG: SIS domain-containing protein, partial [Ilumatobacteraceae bacterium]